jgi:hypothetical protein
LDGEQWVSCKPGLFLSVRVLSRLFRRRFLEELSKMHAAGQLHIRRLLLHILPSGIHRVRHYGLLANTGRRDHLALHRNEK